MKLLRLAALSRILAACPVLLATWRLSHARGGQIAFVSQRNRNGKSEIYLVNSDGSGLTQLTTTQTWADVLRRRFPKLYPLIVRSRSLAGTGIRDLAPVWSPDSRQIAFLSYRDNNPDIYVTAIDGATRSRPINLTNDPAYDGFAAWQPNP